jgi:excinuclease ABC subunit A
VIASSDWIVDLGPGGGDAGGKVMASGPPAKVAGSKRSATAPHLERRLRAGGPLARVGRARP